MTEREKTGKQKLQLGNGGVASGVIKEIREVCFFRIGSRTVRLRALEVGNVSASGVGLKATDRRFHNARDLESL